jgi:hypothetical protein
MEEGTQVIDAALVHGQRTSLALDASDFCGPVVPGPPEIRENRTDLCAGSSRKGAWLLSEMKATGGETVSATLTLRAYDNDAAAQRARRVSIARMGSKRVMVPGGAPSWCYADAIWADTSLWTLEYGCHVSIAHVPELQAVQEALRAMGEPSHGAIGVVGSHSGHGWLIDESGAPYTVPADQRWWTTARVVGVEAGDVLWVRSALPQGGQLGEKTSKLQPRATCVPVLDKQDGWWSVIGPSGVGWASGRYLDDTPCE